MIGGNISAELQIRTGALKNEIGEHVPTWETVNTLWGFLDFSSGEARYSAYNAKIQESTHIFICDYAPLDERAFSENSRMVIGGRRYDVTLIDDPMELHEHFEIYLKFTGGQSDAGEV